MSPMTSSEQQPTRPPQRRWRAPLVLGLLLVGLLGMHAPAPRGLTSGTHPPPPPPPPPRPAPRGPPPPASLVLTACGGGSDTSGSANESHSNSSSASDSAGAHNAQDIAFAQGMIPHHQQAVQMAGLAAD